MKQEPKHRDDYIYDEQEPKHCDDYIYDFDTPKCLQWFIFWHRHSASDKIILARNVEEPKLFAKWKDEWVRVVMISRFGDVGITSELDTDHGYSHRVSLEELTDFTSVKPKTEG